MAAAEALLRSRTHPGPALADGLLAGDVFMDDVMLVVVAWTLGSGSRVARARADALQERVVASLREQEAQTALAVQDERARIARELHDIVAHHVSVVVAQARAGGAVCTCDPQAAREALSCIERTGRQALGGMRRLLDVLGPVEDECAVAPQPALSSLPALVASVRAAGLPVRVEVRGDRRTLDAGLELSAYRIVQESLTNALKHGACTEARVVLTYGPDLLRLQIDDQGPDRAPPIPRRGLIGMRQRTELLGGRLRAGPGARGGFSVTATLPAPAGP